jgi:hypothetical protein
MLHKAVGIGANRFLSMSIGLKVPMTPEGPYPRAQNLSNLVNFGMLQT